MQTSEAEKDWLRRICGGQPVTEQKIAPAKEAEHKPVAGKKAKGHGFGDIAGMNELKEFVTEGFINVLKNRKCAEVYGIKPPSMLFYGPAGCGKTFFAEKMAEEIGINFMKKCIILFMVALLASCSDTQLAESIADVKESALVKENADGSAEINALVERARWGDGQAYLQLADCYRDGIGVKKDFLGMMAMVEQARIHGAIHNKMEYLTQIPDDNDIKHFCNLMDKSSDQLREEKDSIMVQLATIDSPDAYAFFGVLCVESGDTIRGLEIIRDASERGSDFAALLNALLDRKGKIQLDKMKLEQLAERTPLAYKLLGKLSLKPDENGIIDERKAAYYYMKADEHALLSRREARWLLAYHKKDVGTPLLTESDVKRLEAFISFPNERVEIVADTVSVDNIE